MKYSGALLPRSCPFSLISVSLVRYLSSDGALKSNGSFQMKIKLESQDTKIPHFLVNKAEFK